MVARLYDTQPSLMPPVITVTGALGIYVLTAISFNVQDGNDVPTSTIIEIWSGPNGTGTRLGRSMGLLPLALNVVLTGGQKCYARGQVDGLLSQVSPWSADVVLS